MKVRICLLNPLIPRFVSINLRATNACPRLSAAVICEIWSDVSPLRAGLVLIEAATAYCCCPFRVLLLRRPYWQKIKQKGLLWPDLLWISSKGLLLIAFKAGKRAFWLVVAIRPT